MPLPLIFSYDTETGLCPDGKIRTVLIQICSITAGSMKEVVMIEGEDCFERFLDRFEETDWPMNCHAYNLSYEISWLMPFLAKRYEWVDWKAARRMKKGTFSAIEDPIACYSVKICNHYGRVLRITDDYRRVGSLSMESAADNVRRSNPEWFPDMERTKETTELYNDWFTYPKGSPERESFLHYARVDAWSQAMIARWIVEHGFEGALTSASNGLKMALGIKYRNTINVSDPEDVRAAKAKFQQKYPPLPRALQDIVEPNILGGFVWGLVGEHKGEFYHYDYSSSYPAEYHHGKLFHGRVYRISADSPSWKRVMEAPNYFRWFLCDFDFSIKAGGMPMISGSECKNVDNQMIGHWNKKMREGHCSNKLLTETYLEELMKNYDLHNLSIWECWFAGRMTGDFAPFIEYCYNKKSLPELKGTMERHIWKLFMNGGIHGKTITKTHRKAVRYPEGHREIVKEINEPEYCSLIGFTAMMNARERLIRHCRMIRECGYEIYMCDTDSMVTDCPPDLAKEILGEDAFETPNGGIDNLGKFEIETFNGKESFDEFRCWGLKRYLELDHGEYRKSAFAGMHDNLQKQMLRWWRTDGTKYTWQQRGKISGEFGKIVGMVLKTAGAEDVWDAPTVSVPFNADITQYERMIKSIEERDRKIIEKYGEEYLARMYQDMDVFDDEGDIDDMISYLKDVRYDEKDHTSLTRRSVKKKYLQQKKEEWQRDEEDRFRRDWE